MTAWMFGLWVLSIHTAPLSGAEPLLSNYPSLPDGSAGQSVAVPVNGPTLLVTVVTPGANPMQPDLRMGKRNIPSRSIGHDPVTRLGFLQINGAVVTSAPGWLDDARNSVGAALRAMTADGPIKCIATGWVKQIGGKVLPLALLRINFDETVPPAGTPLLDSADRVVAIVFQGVNTSSGNSGYAIPAEAVHRVRRDVCNGGRLVRGWLGLTLHSESQSPRIVRVLPDSPAAEAGIRPGDILLLVGTRQISDYADAANAFFYLVPGQATRLKLLRGSKQMEFTLTPTRPQLE